MQTRLRAVVRTGPLALLLVLASTFAGDRAHAGIGIPCQLGHASPTGFEPCTACAPGTVARFFGRTSCEPCPDGTAATGSGAFECDDCRCDDATTCTHDSCNPATAACTAEPVASCELIHVEFAGVIFQNDGFPFVTEGMPVVGSYDVDPSAADLSRTDPNRGEYTALWSLDVSVGDNPVVFIATAQRGVMNVFVPDQVYGVAFSGLDVTTPTDGMGDDLDISLESTAGAFDDDALIAVPDVASFDELQQIRISTSGFPPFGGISMWAHDIVVTPEPGAAILACGALAGLIAALASSR